MFTKFVNLVVNLYFTVVGEVNIAYYNVLYKIHSICYDEMERLCHNLERDSNEEDQDNPDFAPMVTTRCQCYYCRRNSVVSEMSILDRSDAAVDGNLP